MEQRFHLFVRRHAGTGYSVQVLTHPHLASFGDDVDEARVDLARVLGRLLARDAGGIAQHTNFWPELRLRRFDLVVRAVQHHRLLPVPMKFTVLTHPMGEAASARDKALRPLLLRIPRLGIVETLAEPKDLDAYVEELIRHHLYMAPLERLLAVAYDGEETLESLVVPYRPRAAPEEKKPEEKAARARRAVPTALAEASRRLNDEAAHGTLDRAYLRQPLLNALAEALAARARHSVLLVGPSGVGKTALVHELAHRIENHDAALPASLRDAEVYTTSGARIVAGMRYLGQWQLRVQRMLDELRTRGAVLHVENLAELLATGSSEDGLDVARFLQPALEAGDVTIVCEAAPDDVARAERTHTAFIHALRTIVVPPLAGADARAALAMVATRIGRERRVRFADDALLRAMDLTERFGDGAALPGGAVQLLRAAAQPDERATVSTEPRASSKALRAIDADAITRAFTLRTGYPRELIDPTVSLDPDAVLARLQQRVVGQDAAMVLLRDLVVTLKTGLSDPSRPLGSFLLLGPTGVGKTESALALAEYLFGDPTRMARFDMSEYAAPGSGVRLVSDTNGREGALARRVREQPFGIVLLDEVEKADASVHDLLLQILGEGRLTDATGRTVSFRNTIVMLTSNLGAETAGRTLGFAGASRGGGDLHAHYVASAAAYFRPELLNRFDHIVPYRPLAASTVALIARRAIERALGREGLLRRGVKVGFDDAVVQRVAALGFDARYGARPLNRAIERWIVGPIARVLAARGGRPPATLEVVVRGDAVAVAPSSAPEVAALDAREVRAELERRAARSPSPAVALSIVPDEPRARRSAAWLADRYVAWCEARGASTTVLSGDDGVVRLDARGGCAAMLAYECGVHEFESGGERHRVLVRVEGAPRADAPTRLYTREPVPSVLDAETGLEHLGAWDEATSGDALDRFVLARAAAE